MNKNLKFRVSSSLKSIVGKDLITNDFVAVFELVKNSIDAGAKKVDIVFDLEQNEPALWIVDNGKGMSFDDLESKWLFLGYSAKREGTEDEYKRTYAGNKGVGRFSCDRLGAGLFLQCRSKTSSEISRIAIDWEKFEIDSLEEFTKIPFEYSESDSFELPAGLKPPKTGVVLKISNFREPESWTREKLLKLKASLGKLVNPFGSDQENTEINLRCDRELDEDQEAQQKNDEDEESEFIPSVNGEIHNNILELLNQRSASIDVTVSGEGKVITELSDRGEIIYQISEDAEKEFKLLVGTEFHATFYYLNFSAKMLFGRRMGISSREFGSVFLYRNGFQVFPVGEQGYDYWKLDLRRAQGHSRFLGQRDIMGRVEVSGDEAMFKESSSRDKGLIDSPHSAALSQAVLSIVKRFERYVVRIVWQDKLDKDQGDSSRLFLDQNRAKIIDLIGSLANNDEIEILDYNRNLVGILTEKSSQFEQSLVPLRKLVDRVGDKKLAKDLDKAEKIVQQSKKEQEEALALAEREAQARERAEHAAEAAAQEAAELSEEVEEERKRSAFLELGGERDKKQLEDFIHHMIYDISEAKTSIDNELARNRRAKRKVPKQTEDVLFRARESIEKILVTSRYLTMANFRMTSGYLDKDDLAGFIFDHLTVVAPQYASRVEIEVSGGDFSFDRRFKPIEMGMVLDNMISNAKKARASKVLFHLEKVGKVLRINVTDNGRGIDQRISNPDQIFGRGFTRTNGSGIGLHFCKVQIEELGGSVSYLEPTSGMGFALEINIPPS